MKVLHIANSFSPLSETFIYDYIVELDRQGVDNHVLTFTRLNEKDRPFNKVHVAKTERDFFGFILRVLAEFNNKPDRWFALPRREIKKIVRQINPDIIHGHFGPMGVLVAPIAEKLKIPLVVSFHGYDASMLIKDLFWQKKYKELNSIVKYITTVSCNMVERLFMFERNKVKIVHVGKRVGDYKFIPKSKPIINFLSVGRLTEKKGFIDLIDAFDLALRSNNDLNLKIIGDGPLKDKLFEIIKKKNLTSKIVLLGSLNHSKVIDQYKKADAFILTSKTTRNGDMEGIPTVLMEAQLCGLPVISTKHSGIPECIPKENHKFLADEGNVEQIKDCIIKLIETDNEELSEVIKRGREKVEKEFNLEIEVNKIIKLYRKVLLHEKQ